MRLDSNPLFRKVVDPWYDGNLACWLGLVAMLAIALFAILGISVARQYSAYRPYQLVAWILLGLCALVILSIGWRLVQRYVDRGAMGRE